MLSVQALQLVLKFGSQTVVIEARNESQPGKLRCKEASHLPRLKTHSSHGPSASCTIVDMPTQM